MFVTDGWPSEGNFNTYVLESDNVSGPWNLVSYMEDFGKQAYFVNMPSKFLSSDGETGYLLYSNNFTKDREIDPPGGTYSMTVQEIKFLVD